MFVEKSGVIQRFHKAKNIGVILSESNGKPERYFFHGSNILEGPVSPMEGQHCWFRYNPDRAVQPGWLPTAGAVRIVEETTQEIVQSILAGQKAVDAQSEVQ